MRILVATDGGAHSHLALSGLLRLPLMDEAEIRVVTVIPRASLTGISEPMTEAGWIVPVDVYMTMQETAEQIAEETANRLAWTEAKVETATLIGDPATQIVEAARAWDADLIVLGCRQRQGLLAWLEGSVSREVLRRAPCSVFIVPAAPDTSGREVTATRRPAQELAETALAG